jgi:hypothetical protein
MSSLWKLFVVAGATLVVVGVVLRLLHGRLGWLGRLPGDLRIGDSIYIPLATCVVLSVVLTIVLNVLVRIFWK